MLCDGDEDAGGKSEVEETIALLALILGLDTLKELVEICKRGGVLVAAGDVKGELLELLDLRLDALLALFISTRVSLVLFTLRSPIRVLVGRLEGGILADGRIGVCVDFLNILRADTVREVSRELLLEATTKSVS